MAFFSPAPSLRRAGEEIGQEPRTRRVNGVLLGVMMYAQPHFLSELRFIVEKQRVGAENTNTAADSSREPSANFPPDNAGGRWLTSLHSYDYIIKGFLQSFGSGTFLIFF